MATTTQQRNKQVVKIADAAMMVDVGTGEILAEKTRQHLTSPTAPAAPSAAKKAAEKLPFNAVVIDGATCPDCGGKVAWARMNSTAFEVCMKQFSEEPECWYAKELPKKGAADTTTGAVDGDGEGDAASADGGTSTDAGDSFYDGGAELGGAQMKTANKSVGDDEGKAKTKGAGNKLKRR